MAAVPLGPPALQVVTQRAPADQAQAVLFGKIFYGNDCIGHMIFNGWILTTGFLQIDFNHGFHGSGALWARIFYSV